MAVPPSVADIILSRRFVASLTIAAMIIMSTVTVTVPRPADALNPDACNCVIFRLDDVQDFWLSSVQTEIIDQFINRNEVLSLGIVMNFVGNDPAIVNKVREGTTLGILELTLHGWNHVNYRTLTQQEQYDTLLQANEKMEALWGRSSKIFIPPYNSYNEDTLAALSQLGLKIISSQFDQEIDSVFPEEDIPGHPDNKIYMAFEGSDITDQYGVYHLPQEIGFYDYEFDPPIKNSISRIETRVDNAIENYGYAVITLHPQDFTIKDPDGNWAPQLDPNEIDDLNELITIFQNKGYQIRTFSSVANIPLPPLVDNSPPVITPPPDIAEVHSTPLTTISDLGTPVVFDNTDLTLTVTNDAPEQFPQGTTVVTWTATDDSGNSATTIQYVTISSSADNTRPVISASTPLSGQVINGPAAGVNILIQGTASDADTGVKVVEVRTEGTTYKKAMQDNPDSWSSWSHVLNIQQPGTLTIVSRATDFFNNQQWWNITPLTVNLSGSDTTPPLITPPPDIVMEATGPTTVVSLGMPKVFDNSDPSPQVSFDAPGAGESEIGFPVGDTAVTWTATDISGNSANATQLVSIVDTTPPTVPELISPEDGMVTNEDNNIQLFWSDATDLVSDVTYELLVATNCDFASTVIDELSLAASTYIIESALPDGTYYWKVRAVDGQDNGSAFSPVRKFTVDTSAPIVTASPPGGMYSSPQTVSLIASESSAIYYTADGSEPDTSSTVYIGPVSVTMSLGLKFFAVDSAGSGGPITAATYVIDTVAPLVSTEPPTGLYNEPVSVVLSANEEATIYYTTDGTTPTTSSAIYTEALRISTDTSSNSSPSIQLVMQQK
ncbi:MAG TPA: chitobiase/beta-hexosaminidase C-terminal domain-containing protein [Nitrososphaera sp.]|nr:chitobiase/beta-hexosaminidase C-terminal domain-containing protein [Nitrososphaera sp.]